MHRTARTPEPLAQRWRRACLTGVWVLMLGACAGQPAAPSNPSALGVALGGATAPQRAWTEAMEARRTRLADVLSGEKVEVLRTPDNVLVLRWPADRAFVASTTEPTAAAAKVWDRVATELANGAPWQMRVQGHSDASTADNDGAAALAAQRALWLRDALAQRGLPRVAMEIEAWGARAPLVANDTPEGRARNRRVELWVTD